MKIIKFRRPHFKYADDSFSHFSYWGVNLPLGNSFIEFTSPSTNNSCYHKEDQMFTGLSDKQGKEIFEGDIVRLGEVGSKYDNQLFEIIYDFGSFQLFKEDGLPPLSFVYMAKQLLDKGKLVGGLFPSAMQFIEVIGNIYETPELL